MAEARRWRLWVRLPQQHFEYFEKYSAKLGISMSQLIAMCAWSGSKIVIPALDLPAHQALELVKQEQEEELMSELYEEHMKEKGEWEDYQRWRKERGLHNDEQ